MSKLLSSDFMHNSLGNKDEFFHRGSNGKKDTEPSRGTGQLKNRGNEK
jgi:hypothetical protein